MEALSTSLSSLRAGRASTKMLDRVYVSYFDTPTPIQQMATVSVQGGTSIVIEPYDKSAIKDIERFVPYFFPSR